MKPKFELTINNIEIANQLPGTWTDPECLALLQQLEFDGANDLPVHQLREYAAMALQDLEPSEAAAELLKSTIGTRLSTGKQQNLAEDMTTERQWEEYPDLSCHELIFNAQVLLNQAFEETPQPEINKVEATLSSLNQAAEQYLSNRSTALSEAFVVRCLASATAENSILNRLFEDQILAGAFPEAPHIAWNVITESLTPEGNHRQRRKLSLYIPMRWTGDIEEDVSIECEPYIEES